nr:hypothetical protein [Haloechinothrix halophila]
MTGKVRPFDMATKAMAGQEVRYAVDARVHLGVRQPPVPPHQHLAVGHGVGDGAENGREIERGHGSSD